MTGSVFQDFLLDEIRDIYRRVEIEKRYVYIQRRIACHRDQHRVVDFAATDQGGILLLPEEFDLRQAALLEPLDENEIHVAKILVDELLRRGRLGVFLHKRELFRGCDHHGGRAGGRQAVAVLSRVIDVEPVSVVFDRTDPVSPGCQLGKDLLDQCGLPGP